MTAIVGIGCRFPGRVSTPAEFWELLVAGRDAITEIPPSRFDVDALYDAEPARPGKISTRWGGFVGDLDAFDAAFFGISPREARRIDPQQRLLLEVVWEALEDGGQPPDRLAASATGVFVGISGHDYADLQTAHSGGREQIDLYVNPGSAASIAANRVSYLLDLRGPSLAVDTACSSALTAVHLACASLGRGECDVAIAAAANALITPEPTIGFSQAGMLSPRGRCRPFDASADGYVRSEGAAAVVLKPLHRAVEDGDPIYAVVLGSGINQDGHTAGLSVPNAAAQQALMETVLREAGLEPSGVQYVEAHGTGTPVGDPREARAIGGAMARRAADVRCVIGSAKGNVGHLESAAGMVGLVKAALALRRRLIPPTINFEEPNPAIPFDDLGLRVATSLEEWPSCPIGRAVAGVNSFGFGGANAHILLGEPPRPPAARESDHQPDVLTLSARSPVALGELARRWAGLLADQDDTGQALGELCATAAVRRSHHEHRLAAVAASRVEFAAQLEAFADGKRPTGVVSGRRPESGPPKLAFAFAGMGPQRHGMGQELLRTEPVFAAAVDECDRLLRPLAGWSVADELTAPEPDSRLAEPQFAHVATFVLQVALAALWRSWGVVPDAVVGHSSGEMAAAYVAGGLDLASALRLAFHRGRLQQRLAGTGGMLAAGVSMADSAEVLRGFEGRVSVAAINGPASLTLSGERSALAEVAASLEERGCFNRMLAVSVPYHSPQVDSLHREFLTSVGDIRSHPATIPFASTVNGAWQDGRPLDAGYWWANVRQPVQFAAAMEEVIATGCELFVEVSPHPVHRRSIAEALAAHGRTGTVLPSLRRGEGERAAMLQTLGALHVNGRDVDWRALFPGERRCVPLPTYPWQRERHWLEAPPETHSGHPLLGRRRDGPHPGWESDLSDFRLAYLDGHLVQDRITIPGAAILEAALAAARAVRDGAAAIVDVAFRRLMAVRDRRDHRLACVTADGGTIEVHSAARAEPTGWTLRATARVAPGFARPAESVDLAAVRDRCPTTVDVNELYATLAERHGLRYEGAFRAVAELWTGDGEALGRVVLPEGRGGPAEGYQVHPALLDAAFHVAAA